MPRLQLQAPKDAQMYKRHLGRLTCYDQCGANCPVAALCLGAVPTGLAALQRNVKVAAN